MRRTGPGGLVAAVAVLITCIGTTANGSPHASPDAGVRLAAARVPVATTTQVQSAPKVCRAGLVALTFDDGPSSSVTPGLVKKLVALRVPATFFMVGSRVATAPAAGRLVRRSGFQVGNHTWSHAQLPGDSDPAVRSELRRTARELRKQRIAASHLMRPPYGAINPRVRRDIRALGLVPVLWTIDSRDWAGGSPQVIAHRILSALRPHRSNIVLQHDGVTNSPNSVKAVPLVVRAARKRGYCFTSLGPRGGMEPVTPVLSASVTGGSEHGRTPVRVRLALDRPATRPVSVRVQTAAGTAVPGQDFTTTVLRIGFPVGVRQAWFTVPVLDDLAYEPVERFGVVLDQPTGVTVPTTSYQAEIVSDDAPRRWLGNG
ncbi:MAG: polysaccharide deacetylase family protein [Marmoricola sp.]